MLGNNINLRDVSIGMLIVVILMCILPVPLHIILVPTTLISVPILCYVEYRATRKKK
jgi:hypothetical protein